MSLLIGALFVATSAAAGLEQGELVKFVSGDDSWHAGCGVIRWSVKFEAERLNGDVVRLYLDCPEMAPVVPKVGDVCRVTYELGPIEAIDRSDPSSPQPGEDVMIIEKLDCGPDHQRRWDAVRSQGQPRCPGPVSRPCIFLSPLVRRSLGEGGQEGRGIERDGLGLYSS